MPTLVEIGPSNASQGQHRRKDATEQIKNLTLAGSRTQVPGFSSADAVTAMPRVHSVVHTRGIAVTASALEKPWTWVRLPASVSLCFTYDVDFTRRDTVFHIRR